MRSRHGLRLLLACSLGLAGCKGKPLPANLPGSARHQPTLDLSQLGKDPATTLRALRMPERSLAARLGAHRLTCSSRLTTELTGSAPQEVKQELSLRIDAAGHFAVQKTTHPQYGQEVSWPGGWIYPRLRFSKFVKRRARPEEPAQIVDRLGGLLPAYVGLLRRFLEVVPEGTHSLDGRQVIRVRLGLAADPASPRVGESSAPARGWRRSLVAKSIEGRADLDAQTGAPLAVELRASWSFHPPAPSATPPASGIPTEVDQNTVGSMRLEFKQRVSQIGRVASIAAPPASETIDNPRRARLEIERQMLTGETALPETGAASTGAPAKGDERGAP